MSDQEDNFVTADLYLSSFLRARGFKYIDLRVGRQVKFVFTNTEKLKKAVNGFYNDEDLVSANSFSHALRDLKAVIFNLPR